MSPTKKDHDVLLPVLWVELGDRMEKLSVAERALFFALVRLFVQAGPPYPPFPPDFTYTLVEERLSPAIDEQTAPWIDWFNEWLSRNRGPLREQLLRDADGDPQQEALARECASWLPEKP